MRIIRRIILLLLVLALAAAGYLGVRYYDLTNTYSITQTEKDTFEYQVHELGDKLAATNQMYADLQTLLQARQAELDAKGQQVQSLTGNLNLLDKMVHTDKELLEKYSSVYFLNENYVPKSLTYIATSSLNRPAKPEQILTDVAPHLQALLTAAADAKVPLQVSSAYRSFGTQAGLKQSYKITYGAGTANSFSADQGYSEHQLGTAVDFTNPTIGAVLTGFDKSQGYAWLVSNAWQYGFILSYPKGNTHFVFEPWHWRYVGVELATMLHNTNKNFYDLDQRDIDEYLVKFSD
jgi:D-alanyl-D-alanine carboxypeptidase